MRELLIVGTGSFLGGICRYYLSGWVVSSFATQRFPLGTFTVNFIGCFIIGIVAGLAEQHQMFNQSARLFLVTGLLGGFTTFSAFGYETLILLRTQNVELALLNIILSLVFCLIAVWVGLRIAALF
jgi:CrcB protein